MDEEKIDEISTRHVRMNKKFLNEFFDTNYTSRVFPLMANNETFQKFCQAVERLKTEFRKSILLQKLRVSQTVANSPPSPSHQNINRPASPKTPENAFEHNFNSPSAPKKPQQAKTRFKSTMAPVSKSPKTPEMDFHLLGLPSAPKRPTASEMRKKPGNEFAEDTLKVAGGSKLSLTPKSARNLRLPMNRMTLKSLDPSYQVMFPSPNQSGMKKITCDKNISNEEVEKVNEIIGNISVLTGAEILGNAIALSTRNTTIVPGKYKLYKILRA